MGRASLRRRRPDLGGVRRRIALVAIKLVHTLAFWIIATSGLLVLFDGLRARPSTRTGAAAAVALGECAVFVGNGFVCPLTPLAERYGARRGSVSDIFLPDWLARNLTWIGSLILVTGLALNVRAMRGGPARGRSAGRDSSSSPSLPRALDAPNERWPRRTNAGPHGGRALDAPTDGRRSRFVANGALDAPTDTNRGPSRVLLRP